MARDPRFDLLFEPLQIGPKVLRNRFYQVPHCTGFGVEKPWSQRDHRAVKADGGWAAVCTEYCTIGPDADETPAISARMWDDHDGAHLALVPQAVHPFGALAGIELSHSGVHGENSESRIPPPGPSQLASEFTGETPMAMTKQDIRRVQADWVRAALRARAAGFDIIYVYGGHSYLPGQFLAPFYNHRTDEYGGSLENRARFWIETLEAVRAAVGTECAIACRIAVSGAGGPGVDLEEGLGFVSLADHAVDLWDVHIGSILEWSKDSGASRFFPEGWQLTETGRVRERTAKPIVGVGRLTTPDRMVEILESGVWDLIGAARPSIADPFLPRKIEEGRFAEIRACIGCNVCVSKGDVRRHLGCTQNATAGEEYRRGWHPERFAQTADPDPDILVVGAGPAGMECAIVLAKRGYRRVRLVDAEPEIGGTSGWIPRLPGLAEWGRVREWRLGQLARLPAVSVQTGRRLDASGILADRPDIVIVATGSHWAADGLNGETRGPIPGADAALPHVLTPEQTVRAGKRPPGRRVVVYDCDRYFMGPGLAELLAAEGHRVTIVTPAVKVAERNDEMLEGDLLRQELHDRGIGTQPGVVLHAIGVDGVRGASIYGDPFELACDGVVLVTQRVSDDGLYHDLVAAGLPRVFRIGDCVAPRLTADAIFDGHRLARELDGDDPAWPAPFRRERPPVER